MAKFKDRLGREWEFAMTVADLKPLAALGIEFAGFDVKHQSLPAALFSDPAKLMDVFLILGHVPDAVDPVDFARGFDTDATQRGIATALEALADFSPTSPQGRTKGRLVREVWEQAVAGLSSKLSTIDASSLPASAG